MIKIYSSASKIWNKKGVNTRHNARVTPQAKPGDYQVIIT